LWYGVFAGPAPIGVTLIPALFGLVVILIVLSTLFAEAPVERFLTARADRSSGRRQRWWRRAAAVPRSLRLGLTAAIAMVRRRDPSLLGALAGWGFDIAALWASFRAFGHSPPPAVLIMGYYVGTLGNAVPRVRRQRTTGGARRSRLSHDLVLATDCAGRDRILPTARHGARMALSTRWTHANPRGVSRARSSVVFDPALAVAPALGRCWSDDRASSPLSTSSPRLSIRWRGLSIRSMRRI
jgi:hypothetical protein